MISDRGLEIIKKYESLHDGDLTQIGLQPKMCPAGVWTEGWGHAIYYKGKQLRGIENKALAYQLSKIKTEAEADSLLMKDVDMVELQVLSYVKVPLYQEHLDALISLVFNIGQGNFKKSTLLKKLNKGDYLGASKEFKKFIKGGGKVWKGLILRRETERELFCEGIDKHKETTNYFASLKPRGLNGLDKDKREVS